MKLSDLNPKWAETGKGQRSHLVFDCPKCPHPETNELYCECICAIPIVRYIEADGTEYIGPVWDMVSDDFSSLSITPSIWHHCKSDPHFFITNGEIKIV